MPWPLSGQAHLLPGKTHPVSPAMTGKHLIKRPFRWVTTRPITVHETAKDTTMKKTLLAIAITGLVAGCSTAQEEPKDPALESTAEKVSYGMGLVMGERMTDDLPDLKMEQFLQGIEH
jgi:hypothetical protein